ncbi:hypothetical protein ASE63_25230 [Bosea sp. Root381]|uniref:hypothetical protein n=1 Tax=Bosea sp. Root381 TaxID=1736524 RepID=UPI0006F24D88|nr:hypothetical protein [Bosea sp. Root381]KRE04917.1 hypothetical protein ASE63_25230 [Bosea sp. Root381]
MSKNKQDLSVQNEGNAPDRAEIRTDLDPIAVVMERVSDDPSVAELLSFRNAKPDLKFAARQAKRLADEAMRVRFAGGNVDDAPGIAVSLTLAGHCFTALTAIWPSDTLNDIEAKLALAEATGPYGDAQDGDYVPALEPETATRIRIKRAAFNVGELMMPPPPAVPAAQDRGLADWPLRHYDLSTVLPPAGGPPVFIDAQVQHWLQLLSHVPDLGRLVERVELLIKTADRLFLLAQTPGETAMDLRKAAEGAQILAYLTAAQIALWPVVKGSDGVKAKRRLAKLIDDRACRSDPLHMQAAIRMLFVDGSWLAKLVDSNRMAIGTPTWIEIV